MEVHPHFVDKVRDVVGSVHEPATAGSRAVCGRRKPDSGAESQPGLPLDVGHPATRTHDCKRNGTTSLFAALDVATGKVIGALKPRHRAEEFISFLNSIDKAVPADLYTSSDHGQLREASERL